MRNPGLIGILSIFMLLAIAGQAQGQERASRPPKADPNAPTDADEMRERLVREMAKKANLERQATLKADTEKLLKLAEELKDSVDKSNENVLSLEVVKKAEEIEKLAHNVKDKMKGPN